MRLCMKFNGKRKVVTGQKGRTLGLIWAAFGVLTLAPGAVRAAHSTLGCGGVNQAVCTTVKATQHDKPTVRGPSGNFLDPRNGGALDIGVATDGTVWIVGTNQFPYRWNGKTWVQYSGAIVNVAVDPQGLPWGTNKIDNIFADERLASLKNQTVDPGKILAGRSKGGGSTPVFKANQKFAKAPTGYVDPKACGGVRQKQCTTSTAWYLSKVKRGKPTSRSFFDPRKGGEWWECPSNRPRRTLYAVTDSRACATKSL